jgi:type I restriction enzyme S subunit
MMDAWKMVKLGEVVTPAFRSEIPMPGTAYRKIGVKLWGEGAYERKPMDGSQTKYARLFCAEAGDIIVNKIWAQNGSVAVVPETLAGCFGSGEFPMFTPKADRLDSRWIHWLTKTSGFWAQCDEKSRGTSGKNRIKPEQFLRVEIPLPPLPEQRRIVARIEELAGQINEAQELRQQEELQIQQMLSSAFHRIVKDAPKYAMREVAPLVRRHVEIEMDTLYPELGIRSFGNGTFHKPALSGFDLGLKRIFKIEAHDLLFSNVFAWEGAIAVAKPEDEGRFGSHRFMSCVPKENVTTAPFLRFYFLTEEGMEFIRAASPGGAGRNRTLGIQALSEIRIPVPPIEKQKWFDALQAEVAALKRLQAETAAELDALLPALLDRAFKGEL